MMHMAVGVALGSIVIAPFIGRWRANVWLRRQSEAAEQVAVPSRAVRNNVVEIA